MSDTTDQHDVPGRAKVSTRAATPTRPKEAPSPDEVETCEEQSEGRSAEPNAVGARQATAAGAAPEPAEQPRPAVEAVENGLAEDRAGTRAEHDAPSDGSPEDASKDVATDDVATDEVATDEVATDEVATDEVATDEVVDTGEGGDDEPTVLDGRSGSDPDDAPRNAVGNGDERGAGDGTDPDSAPRDLAGRGAEQAEGSRTLAESPAESPAAADGAGREAAAQVGAGPVAAGPVAAENDTTEGAAVEGAAAGPADAGTPVTEGAEAGTAAVEGAAAGTADAGTPVTEGAEAEGAEAEGAEAEGGPGGRSALLSARFWGASPAGLLIGLLLALLGFGLVIQLQSNTGSGLVGRRQDDLVRILDDLSSREERLRQQIAALENTRDRLSAGGDSSQAALQEARRRAADLGILAGTLAAEGPGIEMTITDPYHQVTAEDMLDAIEELRGAGAEAISVGPARIGLSSAFTQDTPTSPIVVDGKSLTAPYQILAIGDPPTLATAMNIPGGVVDTVRSRDAETQIVQQKRLVIRALREVRAPQYAQPSPTPTN